MSACRKVLESAGSVQVLDKIRRAFQWIWTILTNLYIKGLLTGRIYQGKLKGLCVPGLNCYSCPAALGSCPLGSLQSVFSQAKRKITGYVFGVILLFGTLFGRLICGWLCPFGLLQELLYKLPGPKYKKDLGRIKNIKYAVLGVFVVGVPLYFAFSRGMGFPAFCKYICPQGTISGLLLSIKNESVRAMIGGHFIWKTVVLIAVIVSSVIIYRPFCRVVCPLGVIYGLFNSFAFVHLEINDLACTNCGSCTKACPMHVDVKKNCNSSECIRCGKCKDACGEGAISIKAGWK